MVNTLADPKRVSLSLGWNVNSERENAMMTNQPDANPSYVYGQIQGVKNRMDDLHKLAQDAENLGETKVYNEAIAKIGRLPQALSDIHRDLDTPMIAEIKRGESQMNEQRSFVIVTDVELELGELEDGLIKQFGIEPAGTMRIERNIMPELMAQATDMRDNWGADDG